MSRAPYITTKGIHGKGGERETEGLISSTLCWSREVEEGILPDRDASTCTPRRMEEEIEFTAEEMGLFEKDLDVCEGPSLLDLQEIADEST